MRTAMDVASLAARSCKGLCGKDTPRVAMDKAEEMLRGLSGWKMAADGTVISRAFVARNFVAAMDFFQGVAKVAEEEGHHPDLHLTSYRNVKVELSTHSIGGLSEADFIMAAKIDQVPVDYSPKWLEKNAQQVPK